MKKGFTIIEIIISVALISVVMLFLFQLLTDVEFESTHPTYAKENQVVRASVMRSVQQDFTSMPLKTIDSTNKRRIKFTFQDGTTTVDKVLTINDTEISYGNDETWELQGQDVKIDTDNIQVKIVGNDSSLCTDIQNQSLQLTEQHCPNYQYVKIVIPITNGNEDNAIDDIEFFYIGEATVFEPDQSLRTYFLKFKNDPGSTIQVNRISTTQSAIASTGDINESNEIYPGDQLRITISADTNYVIDSYSVEGYPEFRSGETIEVKQNVIIESKSHVPEYSLKVENGTGTNIVINRTFSEVGGTGVIHQGDKIYQGDRILISVTTNTSAYNTPTLKANGATIASGTEYTVDRPIEGRLVVSSSATVREYTLTKTQGDGTTLTIQRTSSPIGKGITGVLENNAKIYYNDVLKVTVSASQGYKDAKIIAGGAPLGNGGTKTVTGNLTISSSASFATYSLSYNLDGGAYGSSHPTSATYNTAFTVNNPTKTGYSFTGWNITGMDNVTHTYGSSTTTATSINGTKVTSFKNLRASAGTVNFKANWSANTYNIAYNLNGGTFGTNHPTTVAYNVSFTVNNPTRSGYTFTGWTITGMDNVTHTYGSATSTGTSLSSIMATTFKNLRSTAGTVTFTATWRLNAYTIIFDGNGGTPVTQTRSITPGSAIGTLPSVTKTTSPKVFQGWYTAKTGGTKITAQTKPSGNTTYYAQWSNDLVIPFDVTIPVNNSSWGWGYNTPHVGVFMAMGFKGSYAAENYYANNADLRGIFKNANDLYNYEGYYSGGYNARVFWGEISGLLTTQGSYSDDLSGGRSDYQVALPLKRNADETAYLTESPQTRHWGGEWITSYGTDYQGEEEVYVSSIELSGLYSYTAKKNRGYKLRVADYITVTYQGYTTGHCTNIRMYGTITLKNFNVTMPTTPKYIYVPNTYPDQSIDLSTYYPTGLSFMAYYHQAGLLYHSPVYNVPINY